MSPSVSCAARRETATASASSGLTGTVTGPDGAPRGVPHRDELRVRPEPGARQVKRGQVSFEQFPGRRELPG